VPYLFRHAGIRHADERSTSELRQSFRTARNRHLLSDGEQELLEESADRLSVVSSAARLRWYRAFCAELERLLEYDTEERHCGRQSFMITLVHVDCINGHNETGRDLRPIRRHYRAALTGLDFIGVIEPALYSYIAIPIGDDGAQKLILWHLHALVWNVSERDMKRLVRRLNTSGNFIPLMPNQKGALHRKVTELDRVCWYLAKRPINAYRIGLTKRDWRGNRCAPRLRQYASRLRPGERVVLFNQLKHLTLPELSVAGGEGKSVLDVMKRTCAVAIDRPR
jgi:hypothetical protein